MSYIDTVNLATNDLGRGAWGRPKTIQDYSIFHGMFTYNIPITTWQETINGTISTSFTNSSSVDGKLKIESGATSNDITKLKTFRNPRYEPNRGHLYSTSVILPIPTALGVRCFGYFTDESGAFFSLVSGSLFAVIRTTVGGVTSDDSYLIDTTGIDLSKGNVFDIQMQWRGVGGYKFFINLKEVKHVDYLGSRTELTMFNPANPLAFESKNLGDNVVMYCGCVDVTSEGGKDDGKTYGSVGLNTDTGESNFVGLNQPIIALRSKLTFNGLINTRDTLALMASAYADEKCLFRIWVTRDFSAITEGNSAWEDYGDGHLEYITMNETGGTLAFDKVKSNLIFTSRVAKENTFTTSALFDKRTEIYITAGEMIVFTLHRETAAATKGGVTFEFGEEI